MRKKKCVGGGGDWWSSTLSGIYPGGRREDTRKEKSSWKALDDTDIHDTTIDTTLVRKRKRSVAANALQPEHGMRPRQCG